MKMMKKGKKNIIGFNRSGNAVLDSIVFVTLILAFAILIIVVFTLISSINTDIQSDSEVQNITKEVMNDTTAKFPTWFDNGFVFMVIAVWIAVILLSFIIDSNPVYIIVSVFLLMIVFIVGAMASNIYEDVATDSEFSAAAAQFPKINFIMDYFLIYTIIIGFTIIIALYGKSS